MLWPLDTDGTAEAEAGAERGHGARAVHVKYRDTILYMGTSSDLSTEQYRELAEFRRQIRQFLFFSEATAKKRGIEAQQHQLLLAVRGLSEGTKPPIGELAV